MDYIVSGEGERHVTMKGSSMKGYSSKAQLRNVVNKYVCNAAMGIFSDEYWHGHNIVIDNLSGCGVVAILLSAEYKWYDATLPMPNAKEWLYEVTDGKHTVFMLITASGAGSVSDPLSKYDITAYAS